MTEWNDIQPVPTRPVGRTRTSLLQLGWWKAGGPPYFDLTDLNRIVEVRRIGAQYGITDDHAPIYGKGLSEMLSYVSYCYIEDEWRKAGLKTRRESDIIFTKCGIYWPWDSLQATHTDSGRNPERVLDKAPQDVTPEDVYELTLKEFEASCARLCVEYIHGYLLHWPLTLGEWDGPFATDLMADGIVRAFAKLWREKRLGAVGLGNITLPLLKTLNEKAQAYAREMGEDGKGFQIHYIQNDRSMLGINYHGGPFGPHDSLQDDFLTYCKEQNIACMAYSALGHGAPITPPGNFTVVEHWGPEDRQLALHEVRASWHDRFTDFARDNFGCSSPAMALAWLMAHDLVPVFSTTSPRSMLDDVNAVNYIEPVRQAIAAVDELCSAYRENMVKLKEKWG